MEEADVLSDRIGIMARGRLQCVGVAQELKRRFGSGYKLSVTSNNTTLAHDFVMAQFASAELERAYSSMYRSIGQSSCNDVVG
jgi:ABC-type multidrug transport system ATPase subunit